MQLPYTEKAKAVLQHAMKAAHKSGQGYIGTEHILLGLYREKDCVASMVLQDIGFDEERLLQLIHDYIAPDTGVVLKEREGYSPKAKSMLEEASRQAERFGAEKIGTEHMLLALIKESDNVAVRLLTTMGISAQKLYMDTLSVMGQDINLYKTDLSKSKGQQKKKNGSTLEQYSRDLTSLAKEGKLDFGIEQNGRNLSGGQKQRLTIARALVRKPDILILDDSSSALDYATDAALRNALKEMKDRPTVFLVSQRTVSIQHADLILVLEDGRLVGMGTHEALLEECKTYEEIYSSQFKKEVSAS